MTGWFIGFVLLQATTLTIGLLIDHKKDLARHSRKANSEPSNQTNPQEGDQ